MRSTSLVPFRAPVRLLAVIIAFSVYWFVPGVSLAGSAGVLLRGIVVDTSGEPLPRATVTVRTQSRNPMGAATDLFGRFRFRLPDSVSATVSLRITSVGFLPLDTSCTLVRDTQDIRIICQPEIIETGRIEVTGDRINPAGLIRLDHRTLATAATKTLIPSDPLAAIRYPQLAHFGLNFASQLRIDGSIPHYYLNGVSIGADPTHFGAFAFIPTPAVEQINFSPQGTSVAYPAPSVIDLRTVAQSSVGHRGELNASLIDVTGSYLLSSERSFVGGTVRKSLIDQIASAVNLGTSRHEIPAPSLTDLLICSGTKINPSLRMTADLYHVEDNLPYDFAQKSGAVGTVNTQQTSTENHLSTNVAYQSGPWSGSLAGGIRTGNRRFIAETEYRAPGDFHVNFYERYRFWQVNADFAYRAKSIEFTFGDQWEMMSHLKMQLTQHFWNLLSPFAHSDNLDFFQSTINKEYAAYDGSVDGHTNSLYGSGTVRLGHLEIMNGLRLEQFSYLRQKNKLASRQAVNFSFGSKSSVSLFYGTFYESPVTTVMDPYQVSVRMYLHTLLPVETRLGTISYSCGALTLGLFKKEIRHRPVLIPDYAHYNLRIDSVAVSDPLFLIVHSVSRSTFAGFSATVDAPHWPSPRFDFYASYAYSQARTSFYGYTMPHDLDAPHRFQIQLSFLASAKLKCSAEWSIHSGYPYSPYRAAEYYYTGFPPAEYEYIADLRTQNTRRFSANGSLNLNFSYRIGHADLFLSLVNATNRGNEMVASENDFIYDAGLIPNIGFQYRF